MMDGWASHVPYLATMVAKTTGPILECGMGWYSTPLLHYMCQSAGRELVSLESNYSWMINFTHYKSDLHRIEGITNWEIPEYCNQQWGLVLVDHGEALLRKTTIDKIKNNADYIIVHDTESDHVYHYEEVLKQFPYRFDCKEFRPWTTIVSMKYDCYL